MREWQHVYDVNALSIYRFDVERNQIAQSCAFVFIVVVEVVVRTNSS